MSLRCGGGSTPSGLSGGDGRDTGDRWLSAECGESDEGEVVGMLAVTPSVPAPASTADGFGQRPASEGVTWLVLMWLGLLLSLPFSSTADVFGGR